DPAARPDAAATAALLARATAGPAPGPAAGLAGPAAAGRPASPGDPALASTLTLPAPPPGDSATPGFLDPPAYDKLAMPGQPFPADGPGLRGHGPGGPGPAGPGSGGPGPAGPGRGGPGEPGLPAFLDPATGYPATGRPTTGHPPSRAPVPPRPGQPAARRSRRGSWRLVATGASIAAIVIAALIGLKLYDRTLTAVPDSAAGAAAAAGTSAAPSTAAGTTGPAPLGPAAQDAAYGPPPPGYAWHTFTAARLGAAAGLAIAVPAHWQAHGRGQAVYLEPAGGGAGIEVSVAPFTAAQPAAQARQEQAAAIAAGQYPGYRRTAIEPTRFRGRPAAAWRFTWRSGALARTTVLSLLVTLPTSAGSQPYAVTVSAPTPHFPAARKAFNTALTTFRPLPG
ncbi:MAG TPA: hypothetical protein VFX25_13775, partial [Streptosporangiaceae bacterium]|nr:hypothetical protein [Streptosporangiaceae bacterium]